jgi:hypothetical protein
MAPCPESPSCRYVDHGRGSLGVPAGSVERHQRGHREVDAAGGVLVFLVDPGAAGVGPEHGVRAGRGSGARSASWPRWPRLRRTWWSPGSSAAASAGMPPPASPRPRAPGTCAPTGTVAGELDDLPPVVRLADGVLDVEDGHLQVRPGVLGTFQQATTSTCGTTATDTTTIAVQSQLNDPSKPSTTSVPS